MSEKRTILLDRKRKIKTPFSKDVLVFLFCILIASFLWFLFVLSKTHETELSIPIAYKNLPTKYIITDDLEEHITLKVKDSGFSFLLYQTKSVKDTLVVDFKACFKKKNKQYYANNKLLKKSILELLPSTMTLISFEPKVMDIHYEELYEKILPVKLNASIQLSHQYILKDKIILKPAVLKVYGPKHMLDTLHAVYTEKVQVSKLDKTTKISSRPQAISKIRFQTNQIQVLIPVELFTEKTINIPIVARNLPPNIRLVTFPAYINVQFFVGLSRFNTIKSSDFEAYIDYNALINNKQGKEVITVISKVENIKNLNYKPRAVEFILEQK